MLGTTNIKLRPWSRRRLCHSFLYWDFSLRHHFESGSGAHALSYTTCVARLPEREDYHPRLSIIEDKDERRISTDPSLGPCGVVIQHEGKRVFIRAHILCYLENIWISVV